MLIPVRGYNVYVEREGTGRPLVLIHGLGTPSVWSRVRGPLSLSFDLIIIHLPGFGSSEPVLVPYAVRDHALLVRSVLDALDLRNAALAGISYGGQVAATLAAMTPERVSALVILCGSGLMKRFRFLQWGPLFRFIAAVASATILRHERMLRWMNGALYADPRNQPRKIVQEFHRMMLDPQRQQCWLQCVRNGAVPEESFFHDLATIQIPALILWGKEDRVIPVRYAGEFQRRITGSAMRVFSGCGHALPLERPEKTCEALAAFLNALDDEG